MIQRDRLNPQDTSTKLLDLIDDHLALRKTLGAGRAHWRSGVDALARIRGATK